MTDDLLRKINRLVADLAISYTHGHAHGPGLIVQLRAALGDPNSDPQGRGGKHKPGPQTPGWRADISALLGTVDWTVPAWVFAWSGARSRSAVQALRYVPDLVPHEQMPEVRRVLGLWASQARVALGYQIPSVAMPGCVCAKRVLTRDGWRGQGCGAQMLRAPARIDEGQRNAAVWCSNPECHDSIAHPECQQGEDGRWSCRSGERDTRHGIRWAAEEFGGLYAAQQERVAG